MANTRIIWVLAVVVLAAACDGGDTEGGQSLESLPAETSGGDLTAWCDLWNGPPISDEEGTEGAMRAILTLGQEAAAVAPSEISAAMQLQLEATRLWVEAVSAAGWDDSALTPEQLQSFEKPEFEAAFDELNEFSAEQC